MVDRKISRKFTLVELLVAMGVFSLILLLVMQFFSGAQRLVTGGGQNNDLYADARVAMDIMSSMLMATYYSEDGDFLFDLDPSNETGDPRNDALYFATSLKSDLLGNTDDPVSVSFVKLWRNGDRLTANIVQTSHDDYYKFFPPYVDNPTQAWSTRNSNLRSILDDSSSRQLPIVRRVTSLDFIPYIIDESQDAGFRQDMGYPPQLIEIRMGLMDKDSYDTMNEIDGTDAKKDFRKQHERIFSRTVFIGERWRQE